MFLGVVDDERDADSDVEIVRHDKTAASLSPIVAGRQLAA
jgi:hypothetical protein